MAERESSTSTETRFQFDLIADKMRDKGCSEDKLNILRMVLDDMTWDEYQKPPNLRNVKRSRLKVVSEVNEVLGFIDTCPISETNRLLIAEANEVATHLGIKSEVKSREVKPWWKRRIQSKINRLRQDIRRLEWMASGDTTRHETIEKLRKRNNINKKGRRVVTEEIKHRVTAKTAKQKRHEERQKQ